MMAMFGLSKVKPGGVGLEIVMVILNLWIISEIQRENSNLVLTQ